MKLAAASIDVGKSIDSEPLTSSVTKLNKNALTIYYFMCNPCLENKAERTEVTLFLATTRGAKTAKLLLPVSIAVISSRFGDGLGVGVGGMMPLRDKCDEAAAGSLRKLVWSKVSVFSEDPLSHSRLTSSNGRPPIVVSFKAAAMIR